MVNNIKVQIVVLSNRYSVSDPGPFNGKVLWRYDIVDNNYMYNFLSFIAIMTFDKTILFTIKEYRKVTAIKKKD